MAHYRFDAKSFWRTFASITFFIWMGATLFSLFWEDKPAQELAVKMQEYKEKVYVNLIMRDSLIGLGAGVAMGIVLGLVGAFYRKPERHIWGDE